MDLDLGVGTDQLAFYFLLSGLAWVVVIVVLRFVVFAKSKQIPVFRITPDRRGVRDMKTCNWLQLLIDRGYGFLLRDLGEDEVKRWLQERVNRVMHLSGGKFEMIELKLGGTAPQLCGVECSYEGPNRVAFYADAFYQGGFSATFAIEHPVQLPLLGTSMFPMQVGVASIDVQTRLKIVWDASNHATEVPGRSALFPNPATRSILEVSLANVPDVSVKMKSEIGARHKIIDSQVITSLLATLAKKWLASHVIWPNKVTQKFKLPPLVVPVENLPQQRAETTHEEEREEGSETDTEGSASTDIVRELTSGWSREHEKTPPDELNVLRDQALGLARVSLMSLQAVTPPPEEEQAGSDASQQQQQPNNFTTISGGSRVMSPY
eukprot:TRINITY_DN2672_c2_g1_i1.p1 TRINITY_DN2672_c2_g1~~TRINITY_DN2672_c2_g1_i1.p1  ORF type:complete len:388 (+),score=69.34 TRINITY_DN2672_c2_g1_i1:28-1164(+)